MRFDQSMGEMGAFDKNKTKPISKKELWKPKPGRLVNIVQATKKKVQFLGREQKTFSKYYIMVSELNKNQKSVGKRKKEKKRKDDIPFDRIKAKHFKSKNR